MKIKTANYTDDKELNEISNIIYKKFKESKKEKIVIVNIGTSRIVGDIIGPLTGSFLIESDSKLAIYGTMNNPLAASILNEKFTEIEKIHKNDFIIAIDACISLDKKDKNGTIILKDTPIKPGYGLGKNLKSIGDLSITAVTLETNKDENNMSRLIKLNKVPFDFAVEISMSIKKLILNIERKIIN